MTIESRLSDVEESLRLLRDADRLQGRRMSATAPTDNYYVGWNNTTKKWEPKGFALVRKTATQGVPNSTTLVDDDDLKIAIGANEAWMFDACIFFEADPVPDIKIAFKVPAGATIVWGLAEDTGGGSNTPVYQTRQADDDAQTIHGSGFGTALTTHLIGTIANGGTAGDLQLRFAQNVADATNPANILPNSWLRGFRE